MSVVHKIIAFFQRWRFVFITFKGYPEQLNRRAEVEQELWNCFHGKRELPDREQCKRWAVKLGVPDFWYKR